MKALLLTDHQKLEITDMPRPAPGPHEVLVRVGVCGICGSDIHGWDGSSGRRIPPLVMGHEAAGEVAEVGSEVTQLQPGQKVTFDSMVSCGECDFCRRGQMNLCDNRRVLGVSCGDYRRHGAFAEYVVVPEHIVYALPAGLPLHHAAMVEPVSVAVHAVRRTPIELGDTAVVVGSGMIGLLIIQVVQLAGCGRVIAVDVNDGRLHLACQLGATDHVNANTQDAVATIREMTNGRGADIALEAVGHTATVTSAIKSVRKGGTVTLVGNLQPEITFPLQSVVTREVDVLSSCACSGEYPRCIEMLARGEISVEPMITARAPLEEGPNWFERLYAGQEDAMKVMLEP